MSVVFDKLGFMRHLESEGTFARPQAEKLSEAFHQAVQETVATTADIQRVEARIDSMDAKFSAVDTKLTGVDTRLAGVDTRLAVVDARLAGADARITSLEAKLDVLRQLERRHSEREGVGSRDERCSIQRFVSDPLFRTLELMHRILVELRKNSSELQTVPELILVETHGAVGLIRLHRPTALNALCDQLVAEIGAQLLDFDSNPDIGAIVLTGSEKAFAAGADIKEMQSRSYPAVLQDDFIAQWETVLRVKKPVIAAVAGFALGGGCELAMMCDMIVCADTAKFGQRRSTSASCPAPAARSVSPGRWASPRRWTCASPGG